MKIFNKIIPNLIIGFIVGVLGQALLLFAGLLVPADLVTPVAMTIFGIIAAVILATGAYLPIAEKGGEGGAFLLCGLMFGAAMGRIQAEAAGVSKGKAVLEGFWGVIKVLGVGFIVDLVLGLFIGKSGNTTAVTPNVLLQFVYAGLIAAAICVIAQILANLKVPFPVVAIVLMIVLGGVFTWLGPTVLASVVGNGGISVTGVGSGNGAYMSGVMLVATGNVVPLIISFLLNVLLVLGGALVGGAMKKHMPSPEK